MPTGHCPEKSWYVNKNYENLRLFIHWFIGTNFNVFIMPLFISNRAWISTADVQSFSDNLVNELRRKNPKNAKLLRAIDEMLISMGEMKKQIAEKTGKKMKGYLKSVACAALIWTFKTVRQLRCLLAIQSKCYGKLGLATTQQRKKPSHSERNFSLHQRPMKIHTIYVAHVLCLVQFRNNHEKQQQNDKIKFHLKHHESPDKDFLND